MRRDIFLHFLNRDTREIFGVYKTLNDESHLRLMRRALNACVALCEDRCIAPPGFIVEDQIAFDLAEAQRAYLKAGIIQFPMRENSLGEFAEKKRVGYERMRDRYSGLFNDTRIGFLGDNATGIIKRKSFISENILHDWQTGPESRRKIWTPVKKLLTPSQVDSVARIPTVLNERGMALTWSAIRPELSDDAIAASPELRNALQHIYFQQYCREFDLIVLSHIQHVLESFGLPLNAAVYSYRRFGAFLEAFDLSSLILDGPADLIVELKQKTGFISFIDAYAGLAGVARSEADVKFFAGRARKQTSFDWDTLTARRTRLFELSPIEVRELDDVLQEAADKLVEEHGLPLRVVERPKAQRHIRKVPPMLKTEAELVLFVALEEELDVLAQRLQLTKNTTTPEASGLIGKVAVDVVCPRNMGRVAAAIATTEYLAKRTTPPKLIMILGIAGGFRENDSFEGHIVCVSKVVDLALRKVVDEKEGGASPNFRREDYRLSDSLSRVIHSSEFDKIQWSFDACALGWPNDRRPSISFGPMASADEVVSSNEWRTLMLEGTGGEKKLLGTEMEAGGVCAVAERRRIAACMLRVISDQADPSKTDNSWRKLGMETVAHLLDRLPLKEVLALVA